MPVIFHARATDRKPANRFSERIGRERPVDHVHDAESSVTHVLLVSLFDVCIILHANQTHRTGRQPRSLLVLPRTMRESLER